MLQKKFLLIILNKYYLCGLFLLLIIFFTIDQILGLSFWSEIKKVLLFENSVTSKRLILNYIFPLISFNQNLGFPILAESQVGTFEPFKQIFNIFFGSLHHINLTFFFRLIILYSSIFVLLKDSYRFSNLTSSITSLFGTFSPYLWNDAVHQFSLGSFYLLPLSIYFVEKFLNNEKYLKYFLLSSVLILLQLLAGHFQYQLICFLILSIYTLITILFSENSNFKISSFKALIFLLTFFFGFLLASIQILPTFELMLDGDRSNFKTTFQGSLSVSGITLFYKPLSKIFNNFEGSISTLGYMIIFIYSVNQLINSFKQKKFLYNKIYIKYSIIFFIIYIISLGDFLSFNILIYKIIPFLESFRAPSRFMYINSFCTLMLFAISFEELKKRKFNIENLNIVFLLMTLVFFIVFLLFNPYIPSKTNIDLGNWRHFSLIFYPFLFIFLCYFVLKIQYLRQKYLLIITIFFCISIIENIYLMNRFPQYSLLFEKKILKDNISKADQLCKKYDINSINIVGDLKDTEVDFYHNYKNFSYNSLLSSKDCVVFYHNKRKDIVKKGLGYNQSSLTTYQMVHLSNYQYKFLEENFSNFYDNEFKYLASLIQYFTNSKVFYVDNDVLKDDLYKFEKNLIIAFIKNYNFNKQKDFFDFFRGSEFANNLIYKDFIFSNFFPQKKINEFKVIELENIFFIPIWQDDNFYRKEGEDFFVMKDFSFGKKISKDKLDGYIYYMPLSFIFGLIVSLLSIFFLVICLIIMMKKKK